MTTPLPDNWIDLAADCGSTKWLQKFIRSYLPQLKEGAIAPQELEQSLTEELESRNLMSPAQQKNYRSNVVQALKVLDENHPAIALVGLTSEQYRELNDQQRGVLAERETQYLTHDEVDALVERATALLESSEWADVAAGLAVLVGRRISEILLSEFESKTAWSITFSGMAKHSDADGVVIEIPTLAPADGVLKAIRKLQQGLKVDDLKLNTLSDREAKRQVNARYSGQVARRVDLHFDGLVPPRTGKDDLYTHLFRAVYATIAAFWFCPLNVPIHKFKAEIQGHFKLAADGRKLPNYAARSNYDDYAIADGYGNRDGRLGVKLGVLPGLVLLEVFAKGGKALIEDEQGDEQGDEDEGDRAPAAVPVLAVAEDGVAGEGSVAAQDQAIPLESQSSGDAEGGLERSGDDAPLSIERPSANAIRYRAANLLAKHHSSQADRLVALQILTGLSPQQLREGQVKAIDPFVLQVDGQPVTVLVQGLLSPIVKFRQAPLPSDIEVQRVCESTFEGLPVSPNQLHLVYAAISHKDAPMPSTTPKVPTKQPKLRSADLERMTKLMAHLGITGHYADLFSALLDAFEQGQQLSQQQQSQSFEDVAATLKWLTAEIDSLRTQVRALEQERDSLQLMHSSQVDVEQLRGENLQLKAQLADPQFLLKRIESLLSGQGDRSVSNPVPAAIAQAQTAPTPAIAPHSSPPQSKKTRSTSSDSEAIISDIIDAIFDWNNNQSDPKSKIRISFASLKDIGKNFGATYQRAIDNTLKNRQQEIEQHHASHLLGVRHNSSVAGYQQIVKAIAEKVEKNIVV